MRWVVRGLSGVNAMYLGIVGPLLMASPATAGVIYRLTALSPEGSALTRILGGLMAGSALVLALFAWRPEAHRTLAPVLLAGSLLNVTAGLAACLAGEIRLRQVTGSLVFQSMLTVALGAFLFKTRATRVE